MYPLKIKYALNYMHKQLMHTNKEVEVVEPSKSNLLIQIETWR